MSVSQLKEVILRKIRKALVKPVPLPFPGAADNKDPLFEAGNQEDLEVRFAENFTAVKGLFSFSLDKKELVSQLTALMTSRKWTRLYCEDRYLVDALGTMGFTAIADTNLKEAPVAMTGCEFLVARTGSILLSSKEKGERLASIYTPVHICVAFKDQLVPDISDAFALLEKKYDKRLPSFISLSTGPSRTLEIGQKPVIGMHGPSEVICFLVDRRF